MGLVEIEWRPSKSELRKFGVAMLVGFAVLASIALFVLNRQTIAIVLAAAGGTLGLIGLTGHKAALPLYWVWMGIAFVMGNIVSRVAVALVYFCVITPMGIAFRILGRDALQRRNSRNSFWVSVPKTRDKSQYERQF